MSSLEQVWIILERGFNWKKAHKAMIATNWQWLDSESTPSIAEMKRTAKDNLKYIFTHEDCKERISCMSGGIQASRQSDVFELEFIITSSCTDEEY